MMGCWEGEVLVRYLKIVEIETVFSARGEKDEGKHLLCVEANLN